MYPVSQEFQEKIKQIDRRTFGKVIIDYTDPFLDQSIEVQASEQANISYPTQIADTISEPFAKIASLDGSWVLDGTYALAPVTTEEAETKQMGWWGKQLAGRTKLTFNGSNHYLYFTVDRVKRVEIDMIKFSYTSNDYIADFRPDTNAYLWGGSGTGALTAYVDGVQIGSTGDVPMNQRVTVELVLDVPTSGTLYLMNRHTLDRLLHAIVYTVSMFDENDNLVNRYNLDEGVGTTAYDSVGTNHGTINGATWDNSESGVFATPYPTLTVSFFPRPITKLQVVGDSKRKERPVDFNIKLYDGNNTLLYTEIVTGNTEIAWLKVLDEPITQVEKMALEITKWSHTGRQVKILEFFTSIQETYEDDDIIFIHLLEEREVSHGSLPVGNISANEIYIELNNVSRKFDAGNTASPLHNLLKPNRRIRAWIGIEKDSGDKEWVPLGVFWSGDWSAPEDRAYAQTTGRDRLEFLRRSEYVPATPRQNISLYDLAVDVLIDAGLSHEEFWVDDELKEYIIPYVGTEPRSHREMLRLIAEACLGQVYCDRHGIIRLEGMKPVSEQNFASASENANVSYVAQVVDGIENPDAKYASLDGSWELDGSFVLAPETEGPQMGWWGKQLSGDVYTTFYFLQHTMILEEHEPDGSFADPYPTLTVTFFDRAIEAVRVVGDSARGEYPVDFTIRIFDGNDNLLSEQQVTGNAQVATVVPIPENPTNAAKIELSIQKWSHPGRQAKILEFLNTVYKLEISPNDYFSKDNPSRYAEVANYIVVETQPVDSNGNKLPGVKVIVKDDESITENGLLPFEFPANPLVQTAEMAEEIAGRLLEAFKDPRRNLELDWRGNPALLLGNVVIVTDNRERNDYKVVRQEIEFMGALRARLTGRRVL